MAPPPPAADRGGRPEPGGSVPGGPERGGRDESVSSDAKKHTSANATTTGEKDKAEDVKSSESERQRKTNGDTEAATAAAA